MLEPRHANTSHDRSFRTSAEIIAQRRLRKQEVVRRTVTDGHTVRNEQARFGQLTFVSLAVQAPSIVATRVIAHTGSTVINRHRLLEDMRRPDVRITVKDGTLDVGVLAQDVRVEVRDYDIQRIGNRQQLWTTEQGGRCHRYFVSHDGGVAAADQVADDLQRFAEDLKTHAGVTANLTPESSPDGLHVLTINKVDYYFATDTGKYDGWGRAIERDSS